MVKETRTEKLKEFISNEIFHYYNKKDPQEMGLVIKNSKEKFKNNEVK